MAHFFESMSLLQLEEQCVSYDLDPDGTRDEKIERLRDYLKSIAWGEKKKNPDPKSNEKVKEKEKNDDEQSNGARNESDFYTHTTEEVLETLVDRISQVASKTNFRFEEIESTFRNFYGDARSNYNSWEKNFESQCEVYELDEKKKFILAKRLMRGDAKLFVKYESKATSWSNLASELKKEFTVLINGATVHKLLTERKKKKEESNTEYLYEMLALASQANIDEAAVVTYIVDGLPGSATVKSFMYEAQTISELKRKMRTYELVQSKSDAKSEARANERTNTKKEGKEKKTLVRKSHCYNCGDTTHESVECPHKDRGPKCFRCNSFGHKSSSCTQSKSDSSQNAMRTMSLQKYNVRKEIEMNGHKLTALFDTGSDITVIRSDVVANKRIATYKAETNTVKGVGGCVSIKGRFPATIVVDDDSYNVKCCVLSKTEIDDEIVIGMDVISQAELFLTSNELKLRKIKAKSDEIDHQAKKEEESESFKEAVNELSMMMYMTESETVEPDLRHISNKEIVQKVRELVKNYDPKPIHEAPLQMEIILSDDTPIYRKPRRLPQIERNEVDRQVNQWLKDGIVRPSHSDFASQVLLTPKKDGTKRLCVDYRLLNKNIIRDRYPLPLIEDQLDKLQKGKIFSTLDFTNGYFHVSVKEESRKYTAFVTQTGQYEFLRVPFGLCISPAVFQRYINIVFQPLIVQGIILIYMDDIVVIAEDENQAVERLQIVLEWAAGYNLNIKWKKCELLKRCIVYLGHEIADGYVKTTPTKTKTVRNFPEPKNIRQVQQFLGLAGYFRKYIEGFAAIARPLSNLLRKDAKFVFEDAQREAFTFLKNKICERPVLMIFQQEAETQLHTDASKHALGAILFQRSSEDGQFHPVHYLSFKTSEAEQKLHSYELEVMAVVRAVQKLRVYLIGNPFTVVTDCQAFKSTMEKKDIPKISRWAMILQEYDFKVIHRAGSSMRHVDALSRMYFIQSPSILHNLIIAQQKDDHVKAIKEVLNNKPYEDYVMHNGLLCKNIDGNIVIVVPEQMQLSLVRKAHEQGHFKQKKLEAIICKEFFIPSLKARIDDVVANCVDCILIEKKNGKMEGKLHPIPKEAVPLDTFHVDHVGPMPSTNKNYQHILTIVDSFTKFVWLFPTKSTTAAETLSKIQVITSTFGNPRRIITDRGTAFTSNIFQDFCKDENINLIFCTTGVPRGNGQVERIHRIIIPILSKLSSDNPEKWYLHVNKVQQMLNKTYQRSIDCTPFELLVGVPMLTKNDVRIKESIDEEIRNDFNFEREQLRKKAKQNIAKVQDENRKSFNKFRKDAIIYKVDDLVSIARTQFGTGMKLRAKNYGPYKIKVVKGNDRYEVEKVGCHEGPGKTTTSADNMKPWSNKD